MTAIMLLAGNCHDGATQFEESKIAVAIASAREAPFLPFIR
jgi:hypothetical protein